MFLVLPGVPPVRAVQRTIVDLDQDLIAKTGEPESDRRAAMDDGVRDQLAHEQLEIAGNRGG